MPKSLKFKDCLVVGNRGSTSHGRAERLIKQLEEHFPSRHFSKIDVSDEDYAEHAGLIKALSKLNKDSLLCIAGGDGTVSSVINVLLTAKLPAKAREAVVLPLWGGNANDLACMMNGSEAKASIPRLIETGKVVPVYPLAITMKNQQGTSLKLATNYASFGVTAYAANLVNQPGYRQLPIYNWTGSRKAIETASAIRAFITAKPFSADIKGKKRSLYDLVLVNGPRMAKLDRFSLKLNEPAFIELSVRNKVSGFYLYMAHLLGWFTPKPPQKTKRSLTVQDKTWAQLDGEVMQLSSGTEVTVQPYALPFYALSTKLH